MTNAQMSEGGYRTQNPATGVVEEVYEFLPDSAVGSVVETGHRAFSAWSRTSVEERARLLAVAADLMESRAEELAAIASREMGKPLREAIGEVTYSAEIIRYYAQEGPRLSADEELGTSTGARAVMQKRPLGLLLGIMPWNYPYYQVARFAAPNLVAGNTILLKHAEICAASAAAMQKLLDDAGLPGGVYQNIFASHDQVAAIIADERLEGVSLTGSERAGSAVAALAGSHLKKVVLELGGSDPYIILSTADVQNAAQEAWAARMLNTGQSCVSNKRIIVKDDIYDDFVEALEQQVRAMQPAVPAEVGSGTFSPLSSAGAAETLAKQVDDARKNGARVVTGGDLLKSDGYYFQPALLTDVTPAARAYREELFGPVAVVYRVRDAEEAVALANDSRYGLGGSVFSLDTDEAERVAQRLDVGMTHVNGYHRAGADMPFGGVKRSGFGRELGPLGLDEFVNRRLLTRDPIQ